MYASPEDDVFPLFFSTITPFSFRISTLNSVFLGPEMKI